MCKNNYSSQPWYINPHRISKFMTTMAHGDSVPHWEAKACRVCISGKGDDWYDVPFAVHYLSVGSTFTIQFEQISGNPVIACKVPEGAGPDSVFRVHLPPSVVQLILDKNVMNRLPLGQAVKDVSAANNMFNMNFRPDFLGQARHSLSNEHDKECAPAVQLPIIQGATEMDCNSSLPLSKSLPEVDSPVIEGAIEIDRNSSLPSRSSPEVDSPIIEGATEMDRNATLPSSIPVLNLQLPFCPVKQTLLDLALFLQSMETFRANCLLGIIESPPMNQSAAIESPLVEEDKEESKVEESKVLRLVLALEACNEGDNNQEDEDRHHDKVNTEDIEDEEDKGDEELLQKVSHLVWESKNDEFVVQPSTMADNRKPAAKRKVTSTSPNTGNKNKRQRRRH